MKSVRTEHDSIGVREVPGEAYYGVQALRASENFRISGQKEHPVMIRSMAEIKMAAARVNSETGRIDSTVAQAPPPSKSGETANCFRNSRLLMCCPCI